MRTYEARNAKGKVLKTFAARGKEHAKQIVKDWNDLHTSAMLRITEVIDTSPTTVGQAAQHRAVEFREEVRRWPDEELRRLYDAGYLGNVAQALGRSGRGSYEELRKAIREIAPRIGSKTEKLAQRLQHEVNSKRLR